MKWNMPLLLSEVKALRSSLPPNHVFMDLFWKLLRNVTRLCFIWHFNLIVYGNRSKIQALFFKHPVKTSQTASNGRFRPSSNNLWVITCSLDSPTWSVQACRQACRCGSGRYEAPGRWPPRGRRSRRERVPPRSRPGPCSPGSWASPAAPTPSETPQDTQILRKIHSLSLL